MIQSLHAAFSEESEKEIEAKGRGVGKGGTRMG